MGQFFNSRGLGDGFVLFGTSHLIALTLLAVAMLWMVRAFADADDHTRQAARITIVALLWGQEISYHLWRLSIGDWTLTTMLPFHLCSAAVWLGGFALLTNSRRLAEYLYFFALAGATQALLTPDIGPYAFPHYRFWQFFISHGLIVTAAVWLTFVERYAPTARSLGRSILATLAYGVVVLGVNTALGSNYLFVSHKPDTASALDLMPPWPHYLWILAGLVVVVYSLLYLPWAIRNAHARKSDWRRPGG